MPTYQSPGIYIEEVAGGARPIEPVGTSTAGFVGTAPDPAAQLHSATAVNSWTQFVKIFAPPGSASTPLSHAVYGFFLNGGSRCYVVNIGADTTLLGDGQGRKGLALLEEIDEIAILAAPGFSDPASYDALLSQCELLKDRVAVLDSAPDVANIDLLKKVGTGQAAKKTKKAGDPADPPAASGDAGADGLRPRQSEGGYGALYFPWIKVQDPLKPAVKDPLKPEENPTVAPSGHIAGVYARSDAMRGVHKAPANEVLRGALDLPYRVTQQEQGELNVRGVNVIRLFASEGIRVWGARTLADGSSEWKYVNVRRLFNMVEESIGRSTRWTVFEPNDESLWKSIRRDVNAFLTTIWRQGALMGRTPPEAFFVKCDAETNPPEDVDLGRVTILIGMAPVKPAEFVIFRLSQQAGGTAVEA